jgi:hypothetical protein
MNTFPRSNVDLIPVNFAYRSEKDTMFYVYNRFYKQRNFKKLHFKLDPIFFHMILDSCWEVVRKAEKPRGSLASIRLITPGWGE